jgi:hypothetical protein
MDLIGHGIRAARSFLPELGGGVERVQRKRQPPTRSLDRIDLAHAAIRVPYGRRKL